MPQSETKSPGDPVPPTPLMSREEFERRFRAVQREESRYTLAMILIFSPAQLALAYFAIYQGEQMPTWLGIAILLMMAATIVVPIRLALTYFERRPPRFGFICPNCNKPLRGFLGFRDFKYAQCPNCRTWLAVE